jgi:hypothetical protein
MLETYIEKYSKLVSQATLGQVEQAAIWYVDAERIAEKVAINLGTTLEIGASVVSSFSPRERWTMNIARAIAFSLGQEVRCLKNNIRMAEKSLTDGFSALKGLKTNAFAKAIAGDQEQVVIDVWMMKAVDHAKSSPSQSDYHALSQAVKAVAKIHGLTPRTTQAIIWIVKRGSHE